MIAPELRYLIANLDESDKPVILAHLQRLDANDRYLRFFSSLSDHAIEHYVAEVLDFDFVKCFGVFGEDRKTLIAFAIVSQHEKDQRGHHAEFGISVDKEHRGKGLAKRLLDRTLIYCKATDTHTLYMDCLRENRTMQQLARSAGLRVVVDPDESHADIELAKWPLEKAVSVSHEIAYQQIALVDKVYRQNVGLVDALLAKL